VLRDGSRRRDDDRHHDVRLQAEHLDVADRCRLERRSRDERQKPRHLRQRLRGRAQRILDLRARCGEIDREVGRPRLLVREQRVGV
jgi:hypothetical protein